MLAAPLILPTLTSVALLLAFALTPLPAAPLPTDIMIYDRPSESYVEIVERTGSKEISVYVDREAFTESVVMIAVRKDGRLVAAWSQKNNAESLDTVTKARLSKRDQEVVNRWIATIKTNDTPSKYKEFIENLRSKAKK